MEGGMSRMAVRTKAAGAKRLGRVNGEWKEEDLSGMELTYIPNHPSINLARITKLDLSRNNLQVISESAMARLVNVVDLDLHSNLMKSLPNSIGCLSRLKRLDASGNMLESLPKTIQACRAVEELLVHFNELTELPDDMGLGLTNLRLLSAHSNKLAVLPSTTHKLAALRSLDAHLNCLVALPKDLHLLPFLHSVDVSQNFHHLRSLPDSIGLLPSLSRLNVAHNRITSLPDSLACAASLHTLQADGNPLFSPPLDVVLNGADAVREYLIRRMTGPRKAGGKVSWIWRLAKCGTFGGMIEGREEDGFAIMPEYNSVEAGFATPGRRYTGMLSPLRIFSRQKSLPPLSTSLAWK